MVVLPYEKYLMLKEKDTDVSDKTAANNDAIDVDFGDSVKRGGHDETTLHVIDEGIDSNGKKVENEGSFSVVDNILTDADVLDYIPQKYKNKSKLILKHMKHTGMSWDSFGRLLVRDECLLDSHIVDLVRDIAVVYKRGSKGRHSYDLRNLLLATHCPRYLLSNSHNDDKKIVKG